MILTDPVIIQREVIDSAREWLEDHLSDSGLPLYHLKALREAGLDSSSVERDLLNRRSIEFNI